LTSFHGIGLVGNFIALQVIGQFGTYFYASLASDPLVGLVTDEVTSNLLVVRHTTSKRCKPHEMTDVLDEKGEPRPMLVRFRDRQCSNKCGFVMYKLCRIFYITYYYYFMPLILLFLSLNLPVRWG
jgi:hypothetical protein